MHTQTLKCNEVVMHASVVGVNGGASCEIDLYGGLWGLVVVRLLWLSGRALVAQGSLFRATR